MAGAQPASDALHRSTSRGSLKRSAHLDAHADEDVKATSLRSYVRNRVGGAVVVACTAGIVAIVATAVSLYVSNNELTTTWSAVETVTQEAQAASGRTLPSRVAGALAQLGDSAATRVSASAQLLALVATCDASCELTTSSIDAAITAARASVAAASSLPGTIAANSTVRDAARGFSQRLDAASHGQWYTWCVGQTGGIGAAPTVAVCVVRDPNVNEAFATLAAAAFPAGTTPTAGGAVGATVIVLREGTATQTVASFGTLEALATAATRAAATSYVPQVVRLEAPDGVMFAVAHRRLRSSTTSGTATVGANITAGHLHAVVLSTTAASFSQHSCRTTGSATCGSTVGVVDRRAGTALLSTAAARATAVASSVSDVRGLAGYMLNVVANSNANFSIGSSPSILLSSTAAHALRKNVAAAPWISVVVSFDSRETTAPALAQARAVLTIADTSMLIVYIVGGVSVVILAAIAVAGCWRLSGAVDDVVAPVERLGRDFRNAAALRMSHVTAYVTDEKQAAENALHSPSEVDVRSPVTVAHVTPGQNAISAQASPTAGDLARGNSRGVTARPPPAAEFSKIGVIALLQQRCNAMAVALERCARFIPRSVLRGQQQASSAAQSPSASPNGGHTIQPDDATAPDVAEVFAPRQSTANEPPRLDMLAESPRGDDVASPHGLEGFRFGASVHDEFSEGRSPPGDDDLSPGSGQLGLGLRRTTATVLHLTFAGFLKLAQDLSLQEAHSVSQVFLTVAVRIIERHSGVVVTIAADKITAAWNAFSPVTSHEMRAAACAFDLRTALLNSEQELWLPDLHWCACVASGEVVAGNSGTESDRAPVVQGPCVDLATELPPLMIAIGVQVCVNDATRGRMSAMRDRSTPWYTLAVDRIMMADGETEMTVYELRAGSSPPWLTEYETAFESLMDGRCQEARAVFQAIIDGVWEGSHSNGTAVTAPPVDVSVAVSDAELRADPQVVRLSKLSTLFGSLGISYVRALPGWQRFEFDAIDVDEAPAQRERRQIAEKRKSVMPDDVLRTELMNLHNLRSAKQSSPKANPPPNARRRSSVAVSAAQAAARRRSSVGRRVSVAFVDNASESQNKPPGLSPGLLTADGFTSTSGDGTGFNRNRRPSKKPFTDAATFTLTAGNASATPPTVGSVDQVIPAGRPNDPIRPALQPGVLEFRDRKNMLFRVSAHVLGRGAAGEVSLGISETGCLVAVKKVPIPRPTQGEEELSPIQRRRLKRKGMATSSNVMADVENLLQEVSVLARLRDEHIVGYLSSAIIEDGSKLAVVMEYISGGSLHGLLQEFEGMPLRTVKRYLRDILKGLAFLHSEKIIHRDLKPHNVLLLIDGSCKLTDFGTSSSIGKIAGTTDVAGTPQYMSPEACRGETLETSSDIWSFGILMAQLITGNLPWKDDGMYVPIRFMYQVGHMDSMVPEVPDTCPDAALDIIMECCQRDPALRPSAHELLTRPFFAAAPTPMRSSRNSRAGSTRTRRSASGEMSPHSLRKDSSLMPHRRTNSSSTANNRPSPIESAFGAQTASEHEGTPITQPAGPTADTTPGDGSMSLRAPDDLVDAAQAASAEAASLPSQAQLHDEASEDRASGRNQQGRTPLSSATSSAATFEIGPNPVGDRSNSAAHIEGLSDTGGAPGASASGGLDIASDAGGDDAAAGNAE